jgi:hypothetical protein
MIRIEGDEETVETVVTHSENNGEVISFETEAYTKFCSSIQEEIMKIKGRND